jgi:hypothetical protein
MLRKGKLDLITPAEALVTIPYVLVDKCAQDIPRPPHITDGNEEAILAR